MNSIWITGGKGFIGRNLAKTIASNQKKVFGIGHGSWSQEDCIQWSYESWMNAEIDFASLNHLASQAGLPETIYHLAGGSAVGPSIQNPYEDFQRTVDTTARLLEWVRQVSPKTKVIGTSSAAVYGSSFDCPIKENDLGHPYSPYGFHKSMLEKLFDSYRESFDLNTTIVRLFSVYGAGLEKQLLWDICQKLSKSEGDKIVLNGTGMELRDWLHVSDAANLLCSLGNRDVSLDVINGGTGIATSIHSVAKLVVAAWGKHHAVEFSGVARKGDPQSLVADTSLATSFGHNAQVPLAEGIKEVVDWFKVRKH
ncbi:hypothetical protein A7981_06925 [Methylovorus sp. MM2]|uniref:NAD-dependent epimerase/dehydratase family protein n=1 Tax=Methylovorus sp. MM2 TaxID=1848038 RepID=UPI0007DE85DF|nr:SDR family oxidoreductase [Methylovorus sp. MM2]OAM53383.1 hypothetical protein A7981_06925 [Methylovorus sp. MM2]